MVEVVGDSQIEQVDHKMNMGRRLARKVIGMLPSKLVKGLVLFGLSVDPQTILPGNKNESEIVTPATTFVCTKYC